MSNSGDSVKAEIFQNLFSLFVNDKTDIKIIKNETETDMDIDNVEYLMTKLI
jgi:hypothetical protein